MAAGAGHQLGRFHLAAHAAPAGARSGAGDRAFDALRGVDPVQHLGLRVVVRVAIKEPFDVGQQDQEIGIQFGGQQRREAVVVAEDRARLALDEGELFGRDGVVLVDHRDDPAPQEGGQGSAQIQVAHPVLKVGLGEQNLSAEQTEPGEALFVESHQPWLAHGGAGLAFIQAGWKRIVAEHFFAQSHGSRTYDQDFAPRLA